MRETKTYALSIILGALALAVLTPVLGLLAIYYHASRDLPDFHTITDYRPALATTVYARDGSIMGYFYHEKRFMRSFQDMPEHLVKAFLAMEDAGFYEHPGIDVTAIVRAMFKNFMAGDIVQGGSTITQQIVKQLLLSSERKYERKVKEAILAYRIENNLEKNEILTIYLNQVFLGAHAYGVEAAARTYFACHVEDLTLAQSALLAGLPKAPSTYNPFLHPHAARMRQRLALNRMLDLGWITKEQHEQALAEPLEYKSMAEPTWGLGAYYLEEVRTRLINEFSEANMAELGLDSDKYGEDAVYELGLEVYTAMDPAHQKEAERALRAGLEASTRRRGWRGPLEHLEKELWQSFLDSQNATESEPVPGQWVRALVLSTNKAGAEVMVGNRTGLVSAKSMREFRRFKALAPGDIVWASVDAPEQDAGEPDTLALSLEQKPLVQGALVSLEPPTGEVVALVGGYDYAESQFNRATQARRQPGSSFKPVVYSAALDKGFTPASIIVDAPFVQGDWRPKNYGGKFYGPTTLRTALVRSRNVVTVRLANAIGIKAVIERAKALGLEPDFPEVLSVSLGAVGVSPLNLAQAYSAFARNGTYVEPRLILRVDDRHGQTLFVNKQKNVQAISPQNAYTMATLLQHVIKHGTGVKARVLKRPVAGKTGTTNNEIDAWFMGFSPYLLSGVYVGFDKLTPMGRGEAGSGAALPIWVDYRLAVEEWYPEQDFEKPDNIIYVTADGQRMPCYRTPGRSGEFVGVEEPALDEKAAQETELLKTLY